MRKLITLAFSFLVMASWGQQNYFQQEVNYTINVKLDDRNHFLYGDEKFDYINNSPQTLTSTFICGPTHIKIKTLQWQSSCSGIEIMFFSML